jgi:hypothetical protein
VRLARTDLQRAVLLLAAAYNVAFGIWAALAPRAFFELMQLEAPRYPAIWATLGMVIGLYGALYAYAAWRPQAARSIVAVGLAGKILGPLGWIAAVGSGELPVRTFGLIAFNDVVWWVPFVLILADGTAIAARVRAAAPYACAAVNLAAGVALAIVLAPGATNAPTDANLAFVRTHVEVWRAGWLLWIAAAISLIAFFAWWAVRLERSVLLWAALAVACAGLSFDLVAESLLASWSPERYLDVALTAFRLTGIGANGLYSVAGLILTARTRGLPPWLAQWSWIVWLLGVGLAVAVAVGSDVAARLLTAALFALLVPWLVVFGRRLA